jgi:hypothetical protein
MVCETKIVAAEDHEALPGAKKDALLAAGAMWPPLPAAPGPAAAPPPAPGPQPLGGAGGAGPPGGRGVCIREFRAAEQEAARRIFYDGILERIPNTAFRGLRQHPRTQLLYALLAGQCAAGARGSAGRRGRARASPAGPSLPVSPVPVQTPHLGVRAEAWAEAALQPLPGSGREGRRQPAPRTRPPFGATGPRWLRSGAARAPGQKASGPGVGTSAGRGYRPRARKDWVPPCVPVACPPRRLAGPLLGIPGGGGVTGQVAPLLRPRAWRGNYI